MTWWIPLRSLLRNRRRTILSVAIIGLGTAISLFVYGFLENARLQIQTVTVDEYGNLQIASPLLWNDTADGYEYLIEPETEDSIRALLDARSAVSGVTSQLHFPALLAAGDQTKVVEVTGQIPGNTTLTIDDLVFEGRPLQASDVASVVIGRSLANQLGVGVDDVVTLTLTTVDGAYNATPLRIAGIYRFSSEQVELQSLFIPEAFAQILLNTRGVDRLVIALQSIQSTDTEAAAIQQGLDRAGLAFEVRTWNKLSPFYEQLAGYFNILFGFLSLAVFILVFFIILQVLTLSFLERTREIGTLRALGTTRGEVLGQLLSESAWLALLGSGAGVAVGFLIGAAFNAANIEWLPPGTVEASVLSVQLSGVTVAPPFLVGVAATLLSSLYPAFQTSRVRVVDALRVE